jgi:hypothetical protein
MMMSAEAKNVTEQSAYTFSYAKNTFLSVAIYLIYSFSSEAESRKVMLPVRI